MYFLVLKWTRLFARLRVHSDFGQSAFHISGYGTLIHGPSSGAALVRTFSSSSIRRSLAIKSHELDAKRQAWSRIRTAVVTSAVLAAILQSSDDFFSFIYSMPKTFRAVWWAFKAGLSYKHFLTLYLDHSSDEFSKAISQLHDYWCVVVGRWNWALLIRARPQLLRPLLLRLLSSQRSTTYALPPALPAAAARADKLLQVCRSNGGVYIKAGQFAGAFGAVPLEYRVKLSSLQDRYVCWRTPPAPSR